MEAADYIKPIEFNEMLEQAKRLADQLSRKNNESGEGEIRECNSISLYNMLQETKENEDLSVILIDCRARCDYDKNHILEAVSVPFIEISDSSVQAAISSSVCNLLIDVDKHYYLIFYGNADHIQIVSDEYRRLKLPLRLLRLQDSFDDFNKLFPFMTSSSSVIPHGVLPICLVPNKIYISSQTLDSSLQSLLHINNTVNLTSFNYIPDDIALDCFQSDVEVIRSYYQSQIQKGGIAIIADTAYDRIAQLFALFLYTLTGVSFKEALQQMHERWRSMSITEYTASFAGYKVDASHANFNLLKSTTKLSQMLERTTGLSQRYRIPEIGDILVMERIGESELQRFYNSLPIALEQWPINNLYPLIDSLSLRLQSIPLESAEMQQLLLSIFSSIFTIPINRASCIMKPILLQLILDCISSGFNTAIALPLFATHIHSICIFLNKAITSNRRGTERAALRCVTCIFVLLSRWEEWECGYTGNPVLLEWLNEDSVIESVKSGVEEWLTFMNSWLHQMLSVERIESCNKEELEFMASIECFFFFFFLVIVFFALNSFQQKHVASFIPLLLRRFTQLHNETSFHNADTCFRWLREALLLCLFFLVCFTLSPLGKKGGNFGIVHWGKEFSSRSTSSPATIPP